ncbi:DivIVA domain-containing protein [Actinoallomurus rhizosphaericola]|uniref:DivIVA domain-containing protein n=1 Tax=Actinoallomurus rhizosphaericola TaxID=2952536 RepID=UPI0020932868|nr:DivIVA domain-containing protein [Actinoallomurus rhizosphaericola]MCO5999471.1 DivIVA domain-containing protein [Actinoallomurus rhizosphaericola]
MNQTFDIVWRGYDRRQVDDYLRRLAQDPAGTPFPPAFDVVLRGYDRHQVERHLTEGGAAGRPDGDGRGLLGDFFDS